jgi:thiol-disulfide isomerase/thioredoxin
MTPSRRPLLYFTLTLLSGAAGFVAYKVMTPQSTLVPATVTELAPASIPEPAEPAARTVPDTLPDIHLADLAGKSHALREYSGHPLIVNFWATWCAPCRREIPLLQQLRKSYSASHLEVLGIAVDFKESVTDFLQKTPIDYPLLVGEQDGLDAAQKFGMELVLPFSVFVDKDGRIIAVKVGELHREEATAILAAMKSLDAGTLALPAAREQISEALRKLAVERSKTAAS